ncbi:hypothetical protein [Sulfobacillus thermosulfidooxidans]|uniref:hypothetical protein n=1 Tax=Sulfobacillus thermosulfidooxidans TaxID=28034 RepID=UPI0004912819|nr:hypothetical protein [Sulfobacillus thermosulfidooxidans]
MLTLKSLSRAIDILLIFLALVTIVCEHAAHIISLVAFPVLGIISGTYYAKRNRTLFLILQFLFLYLLLAEATFWIVFQGHSLAIIIATLIPLIIVSLYTFSVEREKLKMLITHLFH